MNDYLHGSICQLIERGRQLCATIPRNLPRDYDTLARTCRDKLNTVVEQLRFLLEDPAFQQPRYQPERLRSLKRRVAELDAIETVGIAALDRASDADHQLNALLEQVTKEIQYPLETPVVTTLSQQYFCIDTELNLLCVPLTEGRFLLHLPDLYHELAHPLLTAMNDPVVEPFQLAMMDALQHALKYVQDETTKEDRRWGPQRPALMLQRWEVCWVKYWMVEFFCDLFAVFTLGPAFAWAHLHLTAKRGENPFDVPVFGKSSHPADDARMRIMLVGLELAGFADEAKKVEQRWSALLTVASYHAEPEYHRCFPDQLLRSIAHEAQGGVRGIGCRMAEPTTAGIVHQSLNQAWTEFWENPSGYVDWERIAVSRLKS